MANNNLMETLMKALQGQDTQEIQPPMAAVEEAQLAELNQEAKSPYQKTNEELVQDKLQQEAQRTVAGNMQQEVPVNNPVSNVAKAEDVAGKQEAVKDEFDPVKKLRENILAYEKKVNEKKEPNSDEKVIDWLTGIGKAANVLAKAKGNSLGEVQYSGDLRQSKQAQQKQQKLNQLQKLQGLYKDYLATQKKPAEMTPYQKAKLGLKEKELELKGQKKSTAAPTEGEKVVDKEFAKEYTKWNTGGRADYEVNSKIFRDAIKALEEGKVDTGSLAGLGTDIPGQRTKTRELQATVRKAINGMLRATLGAQFTEKEGERIFQQTFDPYASKEANIRNMQLELKKLDKRKASIDDMTNYYKENKTLAGYDAPQTTPEIKQQPEANEVRRKTKDGKIAIFDADTKKFLRYED